LTARSHIVAVVVPRTPRVDDDAAAGRRVPEGALRRTAASGLVERIEDVVLRDELIVDGVAAACWICMLIDPPVARVDGVNAAGVKPEFEDRPAADGTTPIDALNLSPLFCHLLFGCVYVS
jgi:hypothetical protein